MPKCGRLIAYLITVIDYRRVCAFFNSREEEYRVLLPFIKEGFDNGDRAFHIVKEDQRAWHP